MDNYTYKYLDDGITLNTDPDPDNPNSVPFVDVTEIEGLSNSPFRITERDREGQDGGFTDAEFEKARTISIRGTVYADPDMIEPFLERLKANYAPTKTVFPLYIQAPGLNERIIFCKSYGASYTLTTARRIGQQDIQVQLFAEDPAFYDALPTEASCGLSVAPSTGRSYNKSYNYGYGVLATATGDAYLDTYTDEYVGEDGNTVDNSISIINSGNRATGALITIFGPVDNPIVMHDTSGKQLAFQISLAVEQYLEINLRNRTVRLNGTANRRHLMTNSSRWFLLEPGVNNLRLLGSDPISGLPDPMMTIIMRGAYR